MSTIEFTFVSSLSTDRRIHQSGAFECVLPSVSCCSYQDDVEMWIDVAKSCGDLSSQSARRIPKIHLRCGIYFTFDAISVFWCWPVVQVAERTESPACNWQRCQQFLWLFCISENSVVEGECRNLNEWTRVKSVKQLAKIIVLFVSIGTIEQLRIEKRKWRKEKWTNCQ